MNARPGFYPLMRGPVVYALLLFPVLASSAGLTVDNLIFTSLVDNSRQVRGFSDIDHDGFDDMILQAENNGNLSYWKNSDTAALVDILNAGPDLVGVGDVNGDQIDDFVSLSSSGQLSYLAGESSLPLSTTTFRNIGPNVGTSWHVRGVGDIDGDGTADIVWQNDSYRLVYWPMKQGSLDGQYVDIGGGGRPGTGWHLRAVADIDYDGTDDLVWQNDSGQVYYWSMQNGKFVSVHELHRAAQSDYTFKGVGDLNGDGQNDIVFQHEHADGRFAYWRVINGITQFEKSPQIKDVVALAEKLKPRSSETINTDMAGFTARFGGPIGPSDHPGGITVTPQGRVVTSMSRSGTSCGVLLYSNRNSVGNENATWGRECVLAAHPSGMQAVGEIVAIAQKNGPKFFKLPVNGHPFAEISVEGLPENHSGAVGITFNEHLNRYVAFVAEGRVTADHWEVITLYATLVGAPLQDGVMFERYMDIQNVAISQQGSHLVTQEDGEMFVLSTFSTNEGPDGSSIASCNSILGTSTTYRDYLVVTKLNTTNKSGEVVLHLNLGITQEQCVHTRPAWRFGGAVAPQWGNTLTALWAGRFYTLEDTLDDKDFEYAFKILEND